MRFVLEDTIRSAMDEGVAVENMEFDGEVLEGAELARAEFFRTSLMGVDLSRCDIGGLRVSEGCAELRGLKISAGQAAVLAGPLGVELI